MWKLERSFKSHVGGGGKWVATWWSQILVCTSQKQFPEEYCEGQMFMYFLCVLMFLFQELITSHDRMTPIATTVTIPGLPKSLALKHVPWKSRRCWEG